MRERRQSPSARRGCCSPAASSSWPTSAWSSPVEPARVHPCRQSRAASRECGHLPVASRQSIDTREPCCTWRPACSPHAAAGSSAPTRERGPRAQARWTRGSARRRGPWLRGGSACLCAGGVEKRPKLDARNGGGGVHSAYCTVPYPHCSVPVPVRTCIVRLNIYATARRRAGVVCVSRVTCHAPRRSAASTHSTGSCTDEFQRWSIRGDWRV